MTEQVHDVENETQSKKNPRYFEQLASEFILDTLKTENRVPRYYQGRVLLYHGTHYREEQHLPVLVRRYLSSRKIPHNNNIIGNVIPIVQMLGFVEDHQYHSLPFWKMESGNEVPFPAGNVVAFRNGLLNLEAALRGDHSLSPHTHQWVALSCLPHDYRPEAKCPRWLAFLDEVLDGDAERISLLQEYFGYCLTADNRHQKALILKGVSRGGKGTITGVLEAVVGQENVTGYNLESLSERFGLTSLVGKLVATVGEVNLQRNDRKYLILSMFNSIIGNDLVDVEWKHNPVKASMRLPVRFVIACNEMPVFADTTGALAERLLVIDFERACPPEKRDPELGNKLVAEVEGITAWAIEGLRRLRLQGHFTIPQRMAESVNKVRRKNSPALAFAQDRLIVSRKIDTGNLPGVEISDRDDLCVAKETAMKVYIEWCAENDVECKENYLAANLTTLLPKLREGQGARSLGRKRTLFGIAIKPDEPIDPTDYREPEQPAAQPETVMSAEEFAAAVDQI